MIEETINRRMSSETKLEGLVQGEITGLVVDEKERYCIVTENSTVLRKFDMINGKEVVMKDGLRLKRGGVLTNNGEFWGLNARTQQMVIFNKLLGIVKVLPKDVGVIQDEQEKLQLKRDIFKFHKYVFYFNSHLHKIYKMTRKTNKIVQTISINRLEQKDKDGEFEDSCSLSFDPIGRLVLILGRPTNPKNLILYDTFARKVLAGPTEINDTLKDMGGWVSLCKSSLLAEIFTPLYGQTLDHNTKRYIAVAGVYILEKNTPFVEIYSFETGNLRLVAQVRLEQYQYLQPVKMFQRRDDIYLVLSNKILKLKFDQEHISVVWVEDFSHSTAFNDFDILEDAIWFVERINSVVRKIRISSEN